MKILLLSLLLVLCEIVLCQNEAFYSVPYSHSSVGFNNTITESEDLNITNYDYLYNGGGVGVGDFNNDGLPDIFFTGNMVNDRLYINEGDLKFTDITLKAGITKNGWSTGVCIFDVNDDGYDDIYVCRSGIHTENLANVLYVNQKDGTFKEQAKEFGLDLNGHHVQAAPLDFDLDGDLDLYIMGHPGKFQHKENFQEILLNIQNGEVESDLLMENENGKFIDITEQSGIFEYGYGLGLAISDVNIDGFPDIIVCNDFDEPDHLFINQQNNTFKDEALSFFRHTSNYSMGNDVGDFNNDGLLDFISVDMAFENHVRSKTNMASMSPEKFEARMKLGWGAQYMHNMLHLNTGLGSYQEISQFAGVAKTDWSWAPLFMDVDMDGYQDLFISNGYKRDTKNNDIPHQLAEAQKKSGSLSVSEFLELIPSVKIENFFFKNNGDLTFSDARLNWGVEERNNSNGAAYADLDLDGDLDLIINNVDTLASIYENRLYHQNKVVIDLSGISESIISGAIFEGVSSKFTQIKEAYFVRGYCSTVEKKIYFYTGSDDKIESLKIKLKDGRDFELKNLKSNIKLTNNFEGFSEIVTEPRLNKMKMFNEVSDQYKLSVTYFENKFDDFEKSSLLPHQLSVDGPNFSVADVDNNGLDDFIISSCSRRIPEVYLQKNGVFIKKHSDAFFNHQLSEDGDVYLFDVNNDQKKDLIISSGGTQFPTGDSTLENRVYIGNGIGMFGLVKNAMPVDKNNSGKIVSEDIDGDGDLDFLICGKSIAEKYPYPDKTSLLVNEKGFFKNKIEQLAPGLSNIGIVNDAVFCDTDGDGDSDLIVLGEWMNIEYFENVNGVYTQRINKFNMNGWWNCISAADIDNDGDVDLVVGNAGLNNKFRPNKDNLLEIYANDFDKNGSLDQVLAYDKSGYKLPVRGRECSSGQMPFIAEKFPTFLDFANSDLEAIYGKTELAESLHLTASEFRSGFLINDGKGNFTFNPFSNDGQLSCLNDVLITDLNYDGRKDIIGVGNRYNTEVETTRSDAGCGIVYIQNEYGGFDFLSPLESGFYAPYNAKSISAIVLGGEKKLGFLIGNNNGKVQLFELNTIE